MPQKKNKEGTDTKPSNMKSTDLRRNKILHNSELSGHVCFNAYLCAIGKATYTRYSQFYNLWVQLVSTKTIIDVLDKENWNVLKTIGNNYEIQREPKRNNKNRIFKVMPKKWYRKRLLQMGGFSS